jgi:4-amino-4-deoxy-L-arabinose transferase-like glycosyltransferase
MKGRGIRIILLCALAVRLAAIPAVHRTAFTSDEREYLFMAHQLLERGIFQDSNGDRAIRAPLYPIMTAGLLWVVGDAILVLHCIGCLLGTVVVWLVYRLSLRLGAGEPQALWSAGIASFYPGLVIYSTLLQNETVYIVFFLMAILSLLSLFRTPRLAPALALGLWGGLAALTRPVFLGFLPVMAALLLWHHRRDLRQAIVPLVGAALVAALVIVPWTIRNAEVVGSCVLIASGGGNSLLAGNNPYSTGTLAGGDKFDRWFAEQLRARGINEPSALGETTRSTVSAAIAGDYMTSHPLSTLAISLRKSYIFWIYPIAHSSTYVPIQLVAVAADILLLAAVVIGVAGLPRKGTGDVLLWGALIYFWLVQAVLHAEARFRLPLVPLLAVMAGGGLAMLADAAGRRRCRENARVRRAIVIGLSAVATVYAATAVLFLRGDI